ncbi:MULTISPECIES: HelD family protein [Gordonia]|uniref:AAA family ATPase n=1 Tax=Gordonia cholesterolivorans TaxID=559625 RepID=A0ABN3HP54_9ACTN|nr:MULTISPECIES: ATP-binding domain-containing protein [Gordonia]AUH68858.1 helicase [Gordonia sp. YC-JH1]KXT56308.1 helicase [Gordonia sp. QH-12]
MPSDPTPADTASDPRLAQEQVHLDAVYGRLDRMRANAKRRLSETLRESAGTPQALSERESYERMYQEDLVKIDAAEHNLYFGRLDMTDGTDTDTVRRIGRIGILDDDEQDTTLLLDWRAPLARPFYLATPASPEDVERRRHIRTRSRAVRSVSDEYLASGRIETSSDGAELGGNVVNEAALVDALNAARTGEMTDIVETIQREQDEIIRSTHRGVTVVQGGPGTGKTAVALHRAAYLLYTYRDMLSRSGVLIIGPNADFLQYIGQVLPSLGETGVLLSTIGDLFPDVRARARDSRTATALKGDQRMLNVLRAAVRAKQALPGRGVTVPFDGYELPIDAEVVKAARAHARSTRRAHNLAQRAFLRAALDELAEVHARQVGADPLDGSQLLTSADLEDIRRELESDPHVVQALGEFWPALTPQGVLRELYDDPALLRKSTRGWTDEERDALRRDAHPLRDGADFSPADVPLLDELAELIGYRTDEAEQVQRAQWRQRLAEAQDALDILTGSAPQDLEDDLDPEILMAYDLIDAEQLAERQVHTTSRTTAERAHDDRTWTFGHVIVDEAQELSSMAWRMVMRRIPNRWMTVIGDTAQTGDAAGADSWREVFEPYVADRWRLHELTVNYRTPSEITRYANRVLNWINPDQAPPESLRSNGIEPYAIRSDDAAAAAVALAEGSRWPGLTTIIASDGTAEDVRALASPGDRATVHAITAAKGLEFDNVILLEPADLIAESPRGYNDLYVALTRATQRLVVVHARALPPDLADLPDDLPHE